MKLVINGADLLFIGLFVFAAYGGSPWWLLGVLPIVFGWLYVVTWENGRFVWRKHQ